MDSGINIYFFYRLLMNSVCFRSEAGADAFMTLHSIIKTTKKHGNSPYNAILVLF